MRLLTSVRPHVAGQIAGISEGLVTNTAFMRLLARMNPHVTNQCARFTE